MARCGCSGTSCSCIVQGAGSISVTGSGSGASPYIVSGGGELTVVDSDTVDLTLTGTGSSGSPYALTADATIDVEDLVNLDTTGVAAGDVIAFDGTDWTVIPAPSAAPGAIVTDTTLEGDGSGGDPLGITEQATQTYDPDWTGSTTNPSIGSGSKSGRFTPDPTSMWVDISIDITAASDTQKGSGLWALSLPVGYESFNGRAQTLSALVTYPNGQVRAGVALLSGGALINRIVVTHAANSFGSTLLSGSIMSTWPSGGHLIITGRYEREP